ncbi:hypothetical protein PT974_07117 [Cladobotryum mycophilum]|uniref:Fungal N-terminal domain-containing protein n=1 Tax=Cladobotryum mycophilum TaxID=491253 RepID=A0ABR0SPM3_9HYPO
MGVFETVGTLLADIANLVSEGLRILSFSDKRQWGQDEHEQVRALEVVLDEARKDFQDLGPLVNGRSQYEHDRRHESIEELRTLRAKFHAHTQNLKDWSRSGGPINPIWVRETQALKRELHRAQCRAAMRVFTSSHEASQRCLGAFLVHRTQRAPGGAGTGSEEEDYEKKCLEELKACRTVGTFQRFGEQDIAFVCDFCDGHVVWTDLERMPTSRTVQAAPTHPPTASATLLPSNANWQATGVTHSGEHQKQIVFAPVAIANHGVPAHGDWEARLLCPLCEEIGEQPQDEDDEEETWRPDDQFDDLASLQEHLEWQHATSTLPVALPAVIPSSDNCAIM